MFFNLSAVNSHFRYYVLFNYKWQGELLQLSKPYAFLVHKGKVLNYIKNNYALPTYKIREVSDFWDYVLKRLSVGLLFPFDLDCLNFDWNKDKQERKSWYGPCCITCDSNNREYGEFDLHEWSWTDKYIRNCTCLDDINGVCWRTDINERELKRFKLM